MENICCELAQLKFCHTKAKNTCNFIINKSEFFNTKFIHWG